VVRLTLGFALAAWCAGGAPGVQFQRLLAYERYCALRSFSSASRCARRSSTVVIRYPLAPQMDR